LGKEEENIEADKEQLVKQITVWSFTLSRGGVAARAHPYGSPPFSCISQAIQLKAPAKDFRKRMSSFQTAAANQQPGSRASILGDELSRRPSRNKNRYSIMQTREDMNEKIEEMSKRSSMLMVDSAATLDNPIPGGS